MQPVYEEVERLLVEIGITARNPEITKKTETISVLCRAYMEPSTIGEGYRLGFGPSKSRIFDLLLARQGKSVSKEAIMDVCIHTWGHEPEMKLADVHICGIRKALKGTKYEGMIETVYGFGYRLLPELQTAIAA